MHAEVAVILGGEPLGHPRLVELMRFTKASGIADRVRVLTNGIRLAKMPAAFWAELDDLKISIYPGSTPPEAILLARRMQEEHGFLLSFYDVAADPFRAVHTHAPRADAQSTYMGCWYRSNTRKIEQGHFWRCCTSPSISQTLLGLPAAADGLALEGLTVEALSVFLARDTFMESCRRCHGNAGPRLEQWSEQRDKSKWLTASAA
jgi:GTP 3',8-cyclase